jgi:hypothetical protein
LQKHENQKHQTSEDLSIDHVLSGISIWNPIREATSGQHKKHNQ